MRDSDYRSKYGKPYRQRGKLPRMAKQMVDARHVAGKGGVVSGVTASGDPFSIGAHVGGFHYPTGWAETRLSLSGSAQEGEQDLMAGATAGLRIQTPTRLAPFIGVEGFAGLGVLSTTLELLDDDDCGCDDTNVEALATIGPEAGVHYWLGPHTRLTGSAGYRVTTSGRDFDHWYYGISLSFLNRPPPSPEPQQAAAWLYEYSPVKPGGPPPPPTPVNLAPVATAP